MTHGAWVVTGRVQGVGFRWFVRERGRHLGLAGWVRNRVDGAVEVAAAGSAEGIASLQRALSEGPPGAVVEQVSAQPSSSQDTLPKPFSIVR